MDPNEENGQQPSDSPADNDVTAAPSTANDSTPDSSTGEEAPASALDAMAEELGVSDADSEEGVHTSEQEADEDAQKKAGEEAGQAPDGETGNDKDDTKAEGKDEENELYKPLPADTKKETAERFNKMIESHKELTQQLEQYEQQTEQLQQDTEGFRELINQSQATPEEFVQLVDYSRAVKTGNYQQAWQMLQDQMQALAPLVGQKLPNVGIDEQLKDHPDLLQDIQSFNLSEERALEIAAARTKQKQQEQARQQSQQQEQEHQQVQQQVQQKVQQAQQSIVQAASQWAESDIDYAAKHEKLMEKAQQIGQKFPKQPELWLPMLEEYYNTLTEMGGQGQQNDLQPGNKNTPLRPNSGSGDRVPQNALEAMAQSLNVTG